jgi:ABC-type dipeptide/oligopeptide/nickel transport system permease component
VLGIAIVIVVAAVAVAIGIAFGIVVAPRLGRLFDRVTEQDDEPQTEEPRDRAD